MTRRGCTHSNCTGPAAQISGLAVATSGLLLASTVPVAARTPNAFTFRIPGSHRRPVTSLVEQHEQPVHLIVVGRDQPGSQHRHPTIPIDGT
jgi:hypothetical protein